MFGIKKMFFERKRGKALGELRTKLQSAGFTLWPHLDPAMKVVELGAEVGILMADPTNSGFKEEKSTSVIQDINMKVAAKHGLAPIGQGPLCVEDAVFVTYCGFWHAA
ncbi:MAG: hypothetical protein Q7S36_00225 [Candidatus Liptonbacteria bacterium]|nr:hypothetical protein [Candidatus Liptonbacteria bacterium]